MCPDYEVDIPHFYCLEYREKGKTMFLEIDFRDPVLYLDDITVFRWQEPYADVVPSTAEKRRILNNVYVSLVKMGFERVVYRDGIRPKEE